jgi:hypothetical protein
MYSLHKDKSPKVKSINKQIVSKIHMTTHLKTQLNTYAFQHNN